MEGLGAVDRIYEAYHVGSPVDIFGFWQIKAVLCPAIGRAECTIVDDALLP